MPPSDSDASDSTEASAQILVTELCAECKRKNILQVFLAPFVHFFAAPETQNIGF